MALSLKDTETDRRARELAERMGESLTTVIRQALRDKLAELRARDAPAVEATLAAVREIVKRSKARPVLDRRTEDEILGWGENGLRT